MKCLILTLTILITSCSLQTKKNNNSRIPNQAVDTNLELISKESVHLQTLHITIDNRLCSKDNFIKNKTCPISHQKLRSILRPGSLIIEIKSVPNNPIYYSSRQDRPYHFTLHLSSEMTDSEIEQAYNNNKLIFELVIIGPKI